VQKNKITLKNIKIIVRKFIIFLLCLHASFTFAKTPKTLPPGYAIASAHPLATQAGLEILNQGGNAFDAAVTVSAVLAVVEPYHSGLGGGGFWLLHNASRNKNIFIDGREVAPLAAKSNMFLDSKGKPIEGLSLNGGLAAAIPGEPAALAFIAQKYGRLSLKTLLKPAIKLAENGFPVDERIYFFLRMGDREQQLKKYKASRKIFLKNNKPYQMEERLVQKDLAKTLRLLAQKGHKGFYEGQVAKKLVHSVNKSGGIWSLKDLSNYKLKIREPLVGQYHDTKVVTAPLPSGGGLSLLTMLNVLSGYPLQKMSELEKIHHIIQTMRLAYWQRNEYLSDPDFEKVPLNKLLSDKNTEKLRKFIYSHKTIKSSELKSKENTLSQNGNTTHFSILDRDGNRVSATLSINYIFGSSVVADGTGVLLNDTMDDFTIKTGEENVFGIVGSPKNKIQPGKRPVSSMTPTFLEKDMEHVAIFGTPGGSRIPSMVLLASLLFDESYGAISMVSKMRYHHQYLPDVLYFEPNTFSIEFQTDLKKLGYELKPLQQYYGDMQAITWRMKDHFITASSDPRNIGQASVIVSKNTGGYGIKH